MKNIVKISELFLLILSISLFISCKKDKPSPPALTTSAVTEITYTTGISGGSITNDGGAAVISRGICWNTSGNPTISDNNTSESAGPGSFTSNISQLTPNTLYYVKAYATNSAGTGYGNQQTFTTSQIAVPILTTSDITAITQVTAIAGGNISDEKGASVTAKGVCWGISENPTIAGNKTSDGTGPGSFTSFITGLSGNSKYYVRAYATNSAGTQYGNQVSFTTSPLMPSITSLAITSLTATTCNSGGNISSDGGAPVTARGVCWSHNINPTILNSKTSNGTGDGTFTSSITGLSQVDTYHVRAYATNSVGTAYGDDVTFTTPAIPTITDYDGNVYHEINIGTQVWMQENLKATHYSNGDAITNANGSVIWAGILNGLYCIYNDDLSNASVYGNLYNWYAVTDTRNICPAGWHVPTDPEWEVLGNALGGDNVAGGKMKETGSTHWTGLNTGADNSSSFTALPGGRRFDSGTAYGNFATDGFWWSTSEYDATTSWSRDIYTTAAILGRTNMYNKSFGFSVRCLKN